MSSKADSDVPLLGLRERKKAKTLAAIQTTALRLFQEQGYDATTIEQIAAAAEVSPSTFFRYFPTKEDVVLLDLTDPLVIDAFKAQPPELSAIKALRNAVRTVFDQLPEEEFEVVRQRGELIFANPELQARMLGEIAGMVKMVTEIVAERTGRRSDEFELRVLAGALMGVVFGLTLTEPDKSTRDQIALIDAGLAQLEKGLKL
jgi:AcrR family transcriptional regulator